MRKALLFIAIAFSIAITGTAFAQPNIQAYFEDGGKWYGSANCPDAPVGTVVDTLYIVANNFDMWISAVEFQVSYPPELWYFGDILDTEIKIGNTATGISLAWNVPKNCFGATVLARATVIWQCDTCDGHQDAPIDVIPNPNQGFLRAVEWPSNNTVDVVGMLSLVCATTPVEETTWGQIKSLYQ